MNPQLINRAGQFIQKAWKPITVGLTTVVTTVVIIIKDKLDRKKYQEELANKKTKKE